MKEDRYQNRDKVVIVPCSGIGKTYGTVSREAAYEVVEALRPESSQLVALSLLVLGDEAARAAVAANPAVTSGIPVQKVAVGGETVTLIALPAIFKQFQQAEKAPCKAVAQELLEQVQIYNPVPAGQEMAYQETLLREYEHLYAEENG